MKADEFAGLETPHEELSDNRPRREYVTNDDVRLHAAVFMGIGGAVLAIVVLLFAYSRPLFEVADATPTPTVTTAAVAAKPAPVAAAAAALAQIANPLLSRPGAARRVVSKSAATPTVTSQPTATAPAGAATVAAGAGQPTVGDAVRSATAALGRSSLREGALIVLVLMCGAIGGLIHSMTSFVDFAGNRQLLRSWVPWLYLRAPIASLLAVIVYLAYRAGAFGDRPVSDLGDLYQIAFAAALAGLFSKQVTDKLRDLVDTVFAASRKPDRKDELVPGANGTAGQGTTAAAPEFNDTVQAVQRLLMELGFLAPLTDGRPSDDGVLDDTTRNAVDVYLGHRGITGEERSESLGEEVDPDFWPRLLELLRRDAAGRR